MVETVIEAAKEVFTELGSGHSETLYEAALDLELTLRGFGPITRQVPCPIAYKGFTLGTGYIDLLINDDGFVIEIKAINKVTRKDEQQLRKYLAGTGFERGVLVNFNPSGELQIWAIPPLAESKRPPVIITLD